MKCALPGVGVGTISVSKPSGASRARSSSATCRSLPGGLEVLVRISCCSRSTTSPSGPSSCARAADGATASAISIAPTTTIRPARHVPSAYPGSVRRSRHSQTSPSTRPPRSREPTSPACSRSSSSTVCGCCRAAGTAGPSVFEAAGLTAADPRLARRPRDGRGGQRRPRRLRGQERRPGRRPLRGGHPHARPQAGRRRPLVRRAADADPRRARLLRGLRRDRPGAVPRRAPAPDLGAEVQQPGAHQPRQPQPRGAAHLRAVPLRVRQRGQRGGGEGALRDLRGAGAGQAALPGRDREPQPVDRGEGRQQEPRARAAAHHQRREGPHGPVGDRQRVVQEAGRTTRA